MRIGEEGRWIKIQLVDVEICVFIVCIFGEDEEGEKRVVGWFYFLHAGLVVEEHK